MLILINILTIVLLTIAFASGIWSLINFWRTQVMMASFYMLSPHIDQNARCASQSEFLSNFYPLSSIAAKRVVYSVVAIGVIIALRYLIGAIFYAYL